MNVRRLIGPAALAFVAAWQSGCARAPDSDLYRTQFFTLGTVIDISLWDVDKERAAEAVKTVEKIFDEVDTRWHAWHPSELTRINAGLAAGETVTISEEESRLLQRAKQVSMDADDLFDPAIGRLVGLWGFHADNLPSGPPPPRSAIEALVAAHPRMEDLNIGPTTVSSSNPAVELDLGGFAKGLAIDGAVDALQAMGIKNAIVNAGGDLRAFGSHGKRPWRIGIRLPTPNSPGVIASIELHGDESVFTSGNYERYYDYEGLRYHHIIDPRTGYPARPAVSSTIIYSKSSVADASSTALMVAGPERWAEIAKRMGISQAMVIDGDMNVYMTPEMAKRVHFEIKPAPKVILSGP